MLAASPAFHPQTRQPCSTAERAKPSAAPKGSGQADVPALLRRAAATIEGLGDVKVVDLIMHDEITDEGDWPSLTVYFHRAEKAEK